MLNWIKALGMALVLMAAFLGIIAFFIALTERYGPYPFFGLIAVILLGTITWAIHETLYY